MRRPAAEINTAGHDSFLDIVSNIVGILVILVMVVGLRIKNAPVPSGADEALENETARLADGRATVVSLRRDVAEIEQQIEAIGRQSIARSAERDGLAAAVAALDRDLQAARGKLGTSDRQQFDLRQKLSDARTRLRSLEGQLAQAQTIAAEPAVVQSYPTPLSQTVDGKELHFQLQEGRIAFVPMERLIEEFKSEAQQKAYKLLELPEFTDTVGPEGGFRLRYTLERRENTLEEQWASGGIRIQLKQYTVVPVSNGLGEPVEAALRQGSRFRSLLAGYRPGTTTVTIWVYPDSFAEFRRLKEELYHAGFATAARPLPDGFPISGSPHGTKSAVE
jgi:hypothetical protein